MPECGNAGDEQPQEHSPPAESLQLIQDVLAGAESPAGRDRHRTERFLAALFSLRQLRSQLAEWEPELISAARTTGASWAELAPALGVASRQAAERRYLRLQPSTTGETTGEQRVRAERDKRAGDRAVASWARRNSATLRQLAGQVSALGNLDGAAKMHADRLQRALGEDDPASLLSPLADARGHLAEEHAALAEQLGVVSRRTDQLRRDAISDREDRPR
ncbi:hypothetical protein SAMN05216266_1435 [Amycolatopsis marina]|uniref:HSP18 transcriptional regulator n=1 Tax=Amycolatopsis marina TaxID=490629 RepID=A0A1I1CPH3_9PSEU|nr:HSP18 transcriptional regulator [Amycolatopsis marina]SFB64387.1 hypothetical protein SAMN05216266_1435 [Amycolatopsis marina]